jgi:hypothetical protein
LPVEQHEGLAVARRQRCQRPPDLPLGLVCGERVARISAGGKRRRDDVVVESLSAPAAQRLVALVAGDPAQPRPHSGDLAQLAARRPRGDECLLGDVVGEREIARDRERDCVDGGVVQLDEALERLQLRGWHRCHGH